jgi:Universal stress protein UspA and related nucleotide-binding proteins
MATKNILVGYNGNEFSDYALKLAMAIAAKRDAHLTGVFARGLPQSVEVADGWLSDELGEQFRAMAERVQSEIFEGVAERFREVAAEAKDPAKVHWIGLKGLADDAVSKIARSFDLTVIGKHVPNEHGPQVELHPDIIALKSGKPVIVVPELTGAPRLCDNVIVAWDGKRASAKAVGDLLQILPPINKLTLLRIGDSTEPDAATQRMLTHIERHGIACEFIVRPRKGSIAKSLFETCAERAATLLVMGAYEHSKFGEDIFGGVTNDVLKMLKIPVFMSH